MNKAGCRHYGVNAPDSGIVGKQILTQKFYPRVLLPRNVKALLAEIKPDRGEAALPEPFAVIAAPAAEAEHS